MNSLLYDKCLELLKRELKPALGCTEPIAIALAAAKAREALGTFPDKLELGVSGNIIKNVRSVIVPNTNGLKGLEVSAIAGAVGGDADSELEVLAKVTPEDLVIIKDLLATDFCRVYHIKDSANLHIIARAIHGKNYALCEIKDTHTNIIRIERNGEILFNSAVTKEELERDSKDITIANIYDFAVNVNLGDVEPVLAKQIEYNSRISVEGMTHDYGVNVGRNLIKLYGNTDVNVRARASAAAGSDARMSGCDMPVIINSGSGNQGMTASLPVIEYAKELKSTDEQLYRALTLSNLIALHLKSGIGKLSAYCGVVCAACGCGAAITYLHGGDFEQITKTVTNTLANVSGIVCDGAKPSCAAKISSAVDAAILGYSLSMDNIQFLAGDGIVKDDIEKTIDSVSRLAKNGMRATDLEILDIMTEELHKN